MTETRVERGVDAIVDGLFDGGGLAICRALTRRQQRVLERRGFRRHPACEHAWLPAEGEASALYADLDASPCCSALLHEGPMILLQRQPLGRRHWRRPMAALTTWRASRRVTAGFSRRRVKRYLLIERDGHLQFLGRRGYWSNKNPFSFGTRSRRWLYNRLTGPLLADFCLRVVDAPDPVRLAKQAAIQAGGRPPLEFLGGLLLETKLIAVFRDEAGRGLVSILPGDELARESRENELAAIGWLRSQALTRDLVPAHAARVEVEGRVFFVQDLLPGMTVDMPCPGLDEMVEHAARLLIEIGRLPHPDGERVAGALRSDLAVFAARFPQAASRLEWLHDDARVEEFLDACGTSWFHGDAKLENFLFSEDGSRLLGMIDFELSRPAYPAGLDLVYLLAYRWFIDNEGSRDCEIDRVLAALEWAVGQAGLWNRLEQGAGIRPGGSVRRQLLECFVMHHFSRRFHIVEPDSAQATRMERLLATLPELAGGRDHG